MSETDPQVPAPRPWHKKKRYIAPLALAGIFGLASASGSPTPAPQPIVAPVSQAQLAPASIPATETSPTSAPAQTKKVSAPVVTPRATAPSSSGLSNDNYYTNTSGNEVHAPAYSESSCSAVGASAQCGDGTCSFSQSHRGTCSHHGGVAEWL